MNNKKYQIFVSSTYRDLFKAREKVIETVLNLYHFPLGMEMFSADDDEQWQIIQEMINYSDFYVVIIGHKYGSLTEEGISYTEKEYDYAKEKGIPVMAFIRNRDALVSGTDRDSDSELVNKLDLFIEKATSNKMCNFWENIDDLATKVAVALPKMFVRKPQIGWIRGNEGLSKEMSEELVELSNENRSLREKVRHLESQIITGKPEIQVLLEPIDSTTLMLSHELSSWEPKVPDELTMEDVPDHLYSYVTD